MLLFYQKSHINAIVERDVKFWEISDLILTKLSIDDRLKMSIEDRLKMCQRGIGMAALFLKIVKWMSYVRLHRRVLASIHLKDNVWMCDDITGPFID